MELLGADDAHVLAAALALIDDVYASESTGRRRPCVSQHRQRIASLEATVAELQLVLATALHKHHEEDYDAAHGDKLWAPVALRQWRERRKALEENARLKMLVRQQRELAQQFVALVNGSQFSSVTQCPLLIQGYLGPSASTSIPRHLAKQVDAVCDRVSSSSINVTEPVSQTRAAQWSPAGDMFQIRIRGTTRHPFKLSSVANQMWEMLQLRTVGYVAQNALDPDEIWCSSAMFHAATPLGVSQLEGPVVLRRVYTLDGGVLLACVSCSLGTEIENNLMAGLQVAETSWMRIVRSNNSDPTSLVYVERMDELVISAAPQFKGSDGVGCESITSRLQRLNQVLEQFEPIDIGQLRQQLDNRLMDDAISRPRH